MPPNIWSNFLCCPSCEREHDGATRLPISLDCGHTLCKPCLKKLHQEGKTCPLDTKEEITPELLEYPVNTALLAITGGHIAHVSSKATLSSIERCFTSKDDRDALSECMRILQNFAQYLQSLKNTAVTTSGSNNQHSYTKEMSSCAYITGSGLVALSRPMQKKIISLIMCQLATDIGREKLGRCLKSLGERCVTEMILQHQNPHQLSGNLWGAVRSRGCQFLGPALQEEVIRLILMALEDGSKLSRKVLVLFVVQELHGKYPQASKTAIGHVVQLLYRASCFKVQKRDNESSLMQLKEEYRKYELIRQEHDKQIVQIAHEAGLRIAPDQWSSLLYGDTSPYHKSRMQSIIDKLQTPQSFSQSIAEFLIALGRTNDPAKLSRLEYYLQQLAQLTEAGPLSITEAHKCLESMKIVLDALTDFVRGQCHDKLSFMQIAHPKYKTSVCRDLKAKGSCPRGVNCTFSHNDMELDKPQDVRQDFAAEEDMRRQMFESEHYRPTRPITCSKPHAIVNPTPPRHRVAPEMYQQHRGHLHPPQSPVMQPPQGPYCYYGSPNEMPPGSVIVPHQQQMSSPVYYPPMQAPVSPAMMAGSPVQQNVLHPPPVHMVPHPSSPRGGYMAGPPPGSGDLYIPAQHGYHRSSHYYPATPPGYQPQYYDNRRVSPPYQQVLPQPGPPRDYRPVPYGSPIREEQFMVAGRHMPEEVYYPAHYAVEHQSTHVPNYDNIHPPEQHPLYEYQSNRPSSDTQQTLATLRQRRDEILNKIHLNQKPAENEMDAIKTEISRDRIEDLAHSLAVSMNAGSQQANLQATLVNSMLSSADDVTTTSSVVGSSKTKPGPKSVDQWVAYTSEYSTCSEVSYSLSETQIKQTLYNSIGASGVREYHPVSSSVTSRRTEDASEWTSWIGLTSTEAEISQGSEWTELKRSLSATEPRTTSTLDYSRSYSDNHFTESGELIIPWSDSPYISKFGPISRASKHDFVSSKVEQLAINSESEGSADELSFVSVKGQPPTELTTGVQTKQPIIVNARNLLTHPVTAVTPIRRPIPSPSLAHSKFRALPDEAHGFTVTNAGTEGSSSTAESVQLKQELRILNNKIDKVEAQVACSELTDLERNLKRMDMSTASSKPSSVAVGTVSDGRCRIPGPLY